MDAQRVKTRGPNPNPTAPASSKRCLTLSAKTRNLIENAPLRAPIFGDFWNLFQGFSTKVFEGVQGHVPKRKKTLK